MKTGRIVAWGLSLLGLTGCLQGLVLDLPRPPQMRSQVVVLNLDSDAPTGWLVDPGQPLPDLIWPRAAKLHLLSLSQSPTTLQLEAGALEFVPAEDPGRTLPAPVTIHQGQMEAGLTGWIQAPPETVQALRRLRIAPLDYNSCAQQGGCNVDPSESTCNLPCPDFTPPALPMQPRLSQIDSWRPVEVDGEVWRTADGTPILGPVEAPTSRCPVGEMRNRNEVDCRAILPCPPPGQWPQPTPPGAVYVRSEANPGDGSSDRPFATLQQALQSTPTSTPIVFEGQFDLEAQLVARPETIADRDIRGICPGRSVLTTDAAATLAEGALRLQGLRVLLGGELELLGAGVQHQLYFVSIEDAAIAVYHGNLELRDSRLQRRGVAIVVKDSAGLQLTRSYIDADGGVHLRNDVRLQIHDTVFEAPPTTSGHGVSGSSAVRVDVDNSVFRGFGGSGITLQRSTNIRIANTQILDVANLGIQLAPCVDEDNRDCLPPGPGGFALTATITRTLIRSVARGIELVDGEVDIEDLVILGASIGVALQGKRDSPTDIALERVAIRGTTRAPIHFDARGAVPKRVRISDTFAAPGAIGATRLETAVRFRAIDVNIERLRIGETTGHGMEVSCAGGSIEDLIIDEARSLGLRLVPSRTLTVHRASIAAAEALVIYPDDPTAVRGTIACTDDPDSNPRLSAQDITLIGGPSARRGLTKCSGGEVSFDRTSISNFETGIYLQKTGLQMNGSKIDARRLGLSTPEGTDIASTLQRLHFEGPARPIETRSSLDDCPRLDSND